MRCNRGAWIVGAALLAAVLAAQDGAPKKVEAPRRLIRLDWLDGERPPLAAARRDIFSPGGAAFAPAEAAGPGLPFRRGPGGKPPAKPEAETEAAPPSLNLRYAGYSRAKAKIVAIVLIDGQARAVEEGEALGLGFTLRKITLQALEIEGPDGTVQSVALEGEQR